MYTLDFPTHSCVLRGEWRASGGKHSSWLLFGMHLMSSKPPASFSFGKVSSRWSLFSSGGWSIFWNVTNFSHSPALIRSCRSLPFLGAVLVEQLGTHKNLCIHCWRLGGGADERSHAGCLPFPTYGAKVWRCSAAAVTFLRSPNLFFRDLRFSRALLVLRWSSLTPEISNNCNYYNTPLWCHYLRCMLLIYGAHPCPYADCLYYINYTG